MQFRSNGQEGSVQELLSLQSRISQLEQYSDLLNSAVDGFWITDAHGHFLDANDSLCNLLDYSREELAAMSLHYIDQGMASEETNRYLNYINENGSDHYETVYMRKDGGRLDVEVDVRYQYFPDIGRRFFAFVRDITSRKSLAAEVHESELKFRQLFEKAADPAILIDGEKIVDCNDAAVRALHCNEKKDLAGLAYARVFPEKQPDRKPSAVKMRENIATVLKTGSGRFESLCRAADGYEFWVDVSLTAIMIGNKQFTYMVWRDITERKRLMEKLKDSEEKFRVFSMSGQDGIVLMDYEGTIYYINPAAEKILGYKEKEVCGKSLDVYLRGGNFYDAQRLQIALAEAMPYMQSAKERAQPGKALELAVARKDSKEIVIELSFLSEMVGNQWRIVGIFRDITDRKQAAETLRKSEEKYRRLFEESKDVVFITTQEGKLVDINKAGVELFGYGSRESLLKVNIARDIYCSEEDRERYKEEIERKGYVNMFEIPLKRKDGERIIVSITANAIRDSDGNVVMYQGIMRDLTGIRRLERQLLELQKLESVGRLIGDIAHNFNNILGIILGNTQLAKMDPVAGEKAQEYLSSIEDAVFRAADVVERLLVFGRRYALNMTVVNMNSLVNDFMRIAQKFVGREIETKVVLTEKLPLAKVDVAQMHQVLLNLVMNAREAMSDKGVLEIVTSKESVDEADCRFHIGVKPGPYVVLTVRDSGTGIDQETTRKIFEPFFTTKKSDGRKGLGLSVVYGIVKQHGGFIDVLSEKGKGATFKVYIPVTREKAGEIKSGEKPAKAGGETILVAEDEKSLRDVASDILRKLGYKVLVASDGLKAVDIFRERQNDIDCVMLDIVMPRLNGRETYREIEKIRPGTPVVFVTGYSLEGIQTSFIVEEGFDAIQKPYTLDVIGKKIREVLDRKKIG